MELNLEWESINSFELLADTTLVQEETAEAIVPDACPDILRIVDAGGQVCLSGKHVYEGGLNVSGVVKAWVLYRPETDEGLCRMTVQLPFSSQTQVSGLDNAGRCVATPYLCGLEARMLNPRKILVRAEVGVSVQVFQPQEHRLCSGIAAQEEYALQQRTREHMICVTSSVEEKEFTFYDEVRLGAGPSGRAQVMSVQAEACCTESRVIGGKLIFKGDVTVRIRYLVEGELCCICSPMAFSQIMEIPPMGEDGRCELVMCVTDVEYACAGEDGRSVNVTLELLGQAMVYDRRPITLLEDAYSTAYHMTAERKSYTVHHLLEGAVRPQSVRELLQTNNPVKQMVDCAVNVTHLKQSRSADGINLAAELRVDLLYLNEQDEAESAHHMLTVTGQLAVAEGDCCVCRCHCPGEVFAVPASGGAEVRFNVEFPCFATRTQEAEFISDATIGELRAGRQAGRPSVVLRMAAPGEELWDVAKACATTAEQIRKANQLEGERLPTGQLLLIPGVR